ncbi:MAG: flavodoxin [Lachnospiraceae bacterium]|nr:flavodoxin [Lachnospiraceae bacterium]
MSNIKVVYWSGTGNTQMMADKIAEGIQAAGKTADVLSVDAVAASDLAEEKAFALGCPSMGVEQLEEGEMEPFMCDLEGQLKGKKVVLFGSYGWGNCEWMDDWVERCENAGATVIGGEGITVLGEPDDEVNEELLEAGKELATL